MSAQICQREDELLEALGRGYVGAELSQHSDSCASCSELRMLAGALLEEHAQAISEAPVPAAGTMWWRMRVRYRREVQETARRSLMVGQVATLVVAIGLVISFFGPDLAIAARHVVDNVRVSTPLLLVVATWALIAPIAGWVALRQK